MATAAASVRAALVPAECPFDFPEVDSQGGKLLRVVGPPGFRYWIGEYSVVPDNRPCPFCDLEIEGHHVMAILPDRSWRAAHPTCVLTAKGGKSDMAIGAPWKLRKHGPCAKCGLPFEGGHVHTYPDVWCDDECTIEYEEVVA